MTAEPTAEPTDEPTAAADRSPPAPSSSSTSRRASPTRRGGPNNPAFEGNLQRLLEAWAAAGLPLVYVRHDSSEADSPLHPDRRGNQLQELLATASPTCWSPSR